MIYRVLVGLSFVAVIVVGCTSDDCPLCPGGSGGSGGTTATTSSGGAAEGGSGGSGGGVTEACPGVAPNSNAACDECRAFECCTEAQACAAEPECLAWLECEDACAVDDYECLRGCWKGLAASPAKGAYVACKQRSCATACGVEACTGPSFNYQDSNDDDGAVDPDACRACRSAHCCQTLTTCLEDADCQEAFECYGTCPDVACMATKCSNAAHGALLTKIAPDWACRNRYCPEACGGGDRCSGGFSGDCETCMHDNCCAATMGCLEDAECLEFGLCRDQCGGLEFECKAACAIAQPIGAGRNHVFEYCLTSNCSAACETTARTCGGLGGMQATCKTCVEANCCDEGQACGTSSECAAVYICVDACGDDTACQDECLGGGESAGLASYQALTTCRTTACATECAP